jgi:hypothetical protein
MFDIQIDDKIIKPQTLLSSGNNFIVYKGIDQFNNEYSIKRSAWSVESPIFLKENNRQFDTYSSMDLLTSAYYGHKEIHVDFDAHCAILLKQAEYLKLCASEYNLTTYGLHYDKQNDPCIVNKFISGYNLDLNTSNINRTIWRIIPSLITALTKYPHGDLKEDHILVHADAGRFSILDPSIIVRGIFETNTDYYPIVPPMFQKPHNGFMNFSDQLAIGILLYKATTGVHPFLNYKSKPYWVREFGSGCCPYPTLSEIYPFITTFPNWFSRDKSYNDPEKEYNSALYVTSVRKYLLAREVANYNAFEYSFFNITPPKELNNDISTKESDLILSLIQSYLPAQLYIKSAVEICN